MRNIGVEELLVIFFVILLLFGSKKLPELARALGKSVSEFKKGRDEDAVKPSKGEQDQPTSKPEPKV